MSMFEPSYVSPPLSLFLPLFSRIIGDQSNVVKNKCHPAIVVGFHSALDSLGHCET